MAENQQILLSVEAFLFSQIAFCFFVLVDNEDFWTTKCERCPEALDNLNEMACLPKYANVRFISIVLDECDGARNIIETPNDKRRWSNIHHYYMDTEFKEHTKSVLGMKQVPFYVILNKYGEIVQKGSKKQVNFEDIPGMIRHQLIMGSWLSTYNECRVLE